MDRRVRRKPQAVRLGVLARRRQSKARIAAFVLTTVATTAFCLAMVAAIEMIGTVVALPIAPDALFQMMDKIHPPK